MKSIFLILFAVATSGLTSYAVERPNIIFVLCDDLGPGDLGVLWQNTRKGEQKFATPNMDQFAREGMILSRHYCPAPSCMASRSSLMTGKHQGHCQRRNTQFDSELPNVHTLGSVMKKAGYATAAIGKWGMQGGPFKLSIKPVRGDRSAKTEPSHPLLRGFDYFYGYTAHRDAHYHYPKQGNRPLYDGFVDVTDCLEKCYSTDLLTARTKKWIVDHQKANPQQPFFTYLCYTAPHSGLRIPTTSHLTAKGNYPAGGGLNGGVQWLDDAAQGQINTANGAVDKGMHPEVANAVGDDGQPWPDHARRHATMVRRIDDALADLIQLLKDLKIDDRTLVVLTSDNGTLREGGLDNVGVYQPDYLDTFGRYDGTKLDLWEGGVRMPTLVRWPSVIKAGSESHAASQFHDWMATFCDLSGVPVPAVSDGVSIVPTLTGKGKQAPGIVYSEFLVRGRTPNYVEFEAARRGRPHGQMQSVLIGDYKGVRVDIKNHQSTFEVYHTLKDPKETTDLAGKPGVPTQKQYQATVLRSRRIDPLAKRPYDNALVPAVTGIATRPGLLRKEYPGHFDWVPQFGSRTPCGHKTVKGLAVTSGAQQFVGYLRVPKNGAYHFALTTNGKAVVRLHDALLIDADSQYKSGGKALSGEIVLQAGLHPLRINYLGATDAAALSLEWQVPGGHMEPIPNAQFCIAGDAARKPVSEANRGKPNVVLIMSDDMGYSDLPKFGKSEIPTPNIDRLAKEGTLFTAAYVTAPICVASRMGLLTGQYQQRFGIYDNIYGEDKTRVFRQQTLVPEVFQKAGYHTGHVGKWHLSGNKRLQYETAGPRQRGFDESVAIRGGDSAFWEGTPVFRNGQQFPAPEYLTDFWGTEACDFIDRNHSNPFFLYLAFNAVHSPMHALDADQKKFRGVKDENRRIYDGMLVAMDRSIGRVLDRLEKHGIADNTIVIFLNDNGGGESTERYARHSRNYANNLPLRGHKFDLFEGGVRVPMILRWPGKVSPETVYNEMVSSTDVYPTLVAAAGLQMPKGQPTDGVDLLPFINEKNKSKPHDWLCWQNRSWLPKKKGGFVVPTPKVHNSAIRKGNWKLVRLNEKIGSDTPPPAWRLYDLANDIGEQNDVAAQNEAVVKELSIQFDVWRSSMRPTLE